MRGVEASKEGGALAWRAGARGSDVDLSCDGEGITERIAGEHDDPCVSRRDGLEQNGVWGTCGRDEAPGRGQVAGPVGAQAIQACAVFDTPARPPDPQQVSHLERDLRWDIFRAFDFDQRGNRASRRLSR